MPPLALPTNVDAFGDTSTALPNGQAIGAATLTAPTPAKSEPGFLFDGWPAIFQQGAKGTNLARAQRQNVSFVVRTGCPAAPTAGALHSPPATPPTSHLTSQVTRAISGETLKGTFLSTKFSSKVPLAGCQSQYGTG